MLMGYNVFVLSLSTMNSQPVVLECLVEVSVRILTMTLFGPLIVESPSHEY